MRTIDLGPAVVGAGHPPYVIAEIGSNHNGDMDLCRRIIDAAVAAGADAVKFQSWTEDTLVSEEEYERNTEYTNKKKHFGTLREMVRAYQFTPEQHSEIQHYCQEQGITFCSSVFSEQEADLLADLDVPFYKIASMDVNNLPLLDYVGGKGRPVILSTGMATLGEVEQAVQTIEGPVTNRSSCSIAFRSIRQRWIRSILETWRRFAPLSAIRWALAITRLARPSPWQR